MKKRANLWQARSENYTMLVPLVPEEDKRAKKDLINRTETYAQWLDDNERNWWEPDLSQYRDYLLYRNLAPSTVNAHLATLRSRYRSLLKSSRTRDRLYAMTDKRDLPEWRQEKVDEILQNIRQAIAVHTTRLVVPESETEYLRFAKRDLDQLLERIGGHSPIAARDRAIIALMYTTGLRENELCVLKVNDLYHLYNGKPALHVPSGRGCVERLIPYGDLIWGLKYVNEWLEKAEIADGPVFRGFYKGENMRPSGISVRALEYILASYPIEVDGEEVRIRPMDLRRAYTRSLYESDMELAAIRENLGVQDINTVLDYIGPIPDGNRIPRTSEV